MNTYFNKLLEYIYIATYIVVSINNIISTLEKTEYVGNSRLYYYVQN